MVEKREAVEYAVNSTTPL